MRPINVKQYKYQPRKDWGSDHWLQHAYVMVRNPWITEDDKEYWQDKINELESKHKKEKN